ncbi:hypothetical protein SAMN05444273_10915 [Litoreibacter ascidiaceicola]|uniref:Uncharacterized protein n=1 Tax=Litoreibacter ascidiaceicola TaxID=1486859 RepID=A0A1M5DF75_9RHOB|nr:hypothetical protein SAMN05444273_10915 [Litoreibacter ascidiaceicola]
MLRQGLDDRDACTAYTVVRIATRPAFCCIRTVQIAATKAAAANWRSVRDLIVEQSCNEREDCDCQILPSSMERSDEIRCAAKRSLLHVRRNAASAIAALAQVRSVPLCRPSNLVRRTTGLVNYARSMVALHLTHLSQKPPPPASAALPALPDHPQPDRDDLGRHRRVPQAAFLLDLQSSFLAVAALLRQRPELPPTVF